MILAIIYGFSIDAFAYSQHTHIHTYIRSDTDSHCSTVWEFYIKSNINFPSTKGLSDVVLMWYLSK